MGVAKFMGAQMKVNVLLREGFVAKGSGLQGRGLLPRGGAYC